MSRRACRVRFGLASAATLLLLAGVSSAAPPGVPGRLSYQGVLLDDQGLPQTGNVDLTLRVYDAPTGGTLLYKQVFLGVPLDSGVFTVTLGPTGSATDTPTNPLATNLAVALTGDLAATGPMRFLEVTVGSEGALARTQILSVPYALRSETAGSADVATTAVSAASVNGLSSDFVTEIFEHTNLDDSGPGNADPQEGLGDTDGDGAANFVDADNDGDTVSDSQEVADGSDINLVTPILTGVAPTSGLTTTATTVTVSGANFEPGVAVVFGSQSPSPQNLTPTSFQVAVGPQASGSVNVQVTRLNGESDLLANAFAFTVPVSVNLAPAGGTPLTATGASQVAVSGIDNYAVDRDGNATPELPLFSFPDAQNGELAVGFDPSGTLVGIRCRGFVSSCNIEVARDSDADYDLADETGVVVDSLGSSLGRILSPSLVFDPSGRTVAGYVRADGPANAVVAHDRNGDGLFNGTNERVTIASTATINVKAEAAVDPSGRVALVWFNDTADTIRVAWDRSADGDYVDTVGGNPELSTLVTLTGPPVCLGAGFAPDGDLAVVWEAGAGPNLARDLNADGDFGDASEVTSLSGSTATVCDAHGMDGFPLAVAHNAGGTLELWVDRNDDADFADTNEVVFLDSVNPTRVAVARSQTGRTFIATATPNQIYADPTP